MKNTASLATLRAALKTATRRANASARHTAKHYGTPAYAAAYARTFALRCVEVDAALAVEDAIVRDAASRAK